MAFIDKSIKMTRLKVFVIGICALAALGSCENDNDKSVYRELLVDALWIQEKVPVPGDAKAYFFSFEETGFVYVYPIVGSTIQEGVELRYIYDTSRETIAIESYGIYTVEEFDTEILRLSGSGQRLELSRVKEDIELPDAKNSD